MPAPRIVVVQVGEEWVVMHESSGFAQAFATQTEAGDAARRLAAAEHTSFVVVVGDAATTQRAAEILSARCDASPPRRN